MLTDEKMTELFRYSFGLIDSRMTPNQLAFTRIIESAATAPLLEEIERLKQRCAELEKDAGRLDYLQANSRCDPKMDGNHVWWPTSFNVAQSLKGPTIRAAIDSAMSGQEMPNETGT